MFTPLFRYQCNSHLNNQLLWYDGTSNTVSYLFKYIYTCQTNMMSFLEVQTTKPGFLIGCVSGCTLGYVIYRVSLLVENRRQVSLARNESYRNLSDLHHLDTKAVQRNIPCLPHEERNDESSLLFSPASGLRNEANMDRNRIFQVVLTGGPCAGKSSSMHYISKKMREQGFDIYVVPEVPALILNGGCIFPGEDGGEALVTFEASLAELQIQMERSFYKIASSTGRDSIILYDRGLLDVAAYLPCSLWPRVLNYNKWIRDGIFVYWNDMIW